MKKKLTQNPAFFVYLILAILLAASEVISPGFLAIGHMGNVLIKASFVGIVAIGQTLVMLTGGIDLSIASTITLTNLVAAQMMNGSNAGIVPAALCCILIGLAVGFVNGACLYYLRIPPMIMTLATGTMLSGIGLIYSKGAPKGYTAPLIKQIATGRIGMLPIMVLVWALIAVVIILLTHRSTFGRKIYLMGSNSRAAKYSGISTARVTILVYAISGLMAGVVGMLYVGYTNTSYLTAGDTFMMGTVSAVVVGGTSTLGGYGGYIGTIAGTIIMTVIGSILTVVNIGEAGRKMVEGALVIALIYFYARRKK